MFDLEFRIAGAYVFEFLASGVELGVIYVKTDRWMSIRSYRPRDWQAAFTTSV
jgi:hypothetical protein